jgi:uncharacterized protein YpmS
LAKRFSWIIYASLLVLVLIAVVMALRRPNATLVRASAQETNSFDEKIQSLALAHQQGATRTVHITEAELTSKLQQGLDEIPPVEGAVVLKAASVHLEGGEFVGVFTLDASGIELFLTMAGALGVQDGRLLIQPNSASLGQLPLPAPVFERILQRQFDSPDTRERLRLPDFIKDVRVENGELLVQAE